MPGKMVSKSMGSLTLSVILEQFGRARRTLSTVWSHWQMVDEWLTVEEAASRVPSGRRGRTVSSRTVRRWMFEGLKGRFLQYVRVGSTPCTSMRFLDEFFRDLTEADESRRFVTQNGQEPSASKAAKPATERLSEFDKRADELLKTRPKSTR